MKKESQQEEQKPLFKNLADVGLPVGEEPWEPKEFLLKWKAIVKKSENNKPLDLVHPQWLVTENKTKYSVIGANKVLKTYDVRQLFQIAFEIFQYKFQEKYQGTNTRFIKDELKEIEKVAQLKKTTATGDPWQEVQNFIYNEYIDWLLSFSVNDKKGKAAKGSSKLLPSVLKNPNHIKIINEWLEDGGFIKEHGKDKTKPYKWVGSDQNEDLGVTSLISADRDEVEDNKKTRTFSKYYQLAALGYWLNDKMNAFDGDCIGQKLCEAVAGYYNMETDANLTTAKAFRPGKNNRANIERYYVYYNDLKHKLSSAKPTPS